MKTQHFPLISPIATNLVRQGLSVMGLSARGLIVTGLLAVLGGSSLASAAEPALGPVSPQPLPPVAAPSPECVDAAAALLRVETRWSEWAAGPRPEARFAEQSLYLDYSIVEVEEIAARFLAVAVFECPELVLDAQYQGGLALDRFADELAAMAVPLDLGSDPDLHTLLTNERRVFEVRVRISAAERWLEGLAYALEHGLEGQEIAVMERRVEEIWDEWEGLQASLSAAEAAVAPR